MKSSSDESAWQESQSAVQTSRGRRREFSCEGDSIVVMAGSSSAMTR
jgi:hypothetical protein